MMKQLTCILLLLSLTACNQESSPDGRSRMRDEKLQQEIEYLKDQNKAMLDSIGLINRRLDLLEQN